MNWKETLFPPSPQNIKGENISILVLKKQVNILDNKKINLTYYKK